MIKIISVLNLISKSRLSLLFILEPPSTYKVLFEDSLFMHLSRIILPYSLLAIVFTLFLK